MANPLRWLRVVLGFGFCLASVGCNAEELTPEGSNVATSNSAPSEQGFDSSACKSLGFIVGRGGGAFGGGYMTNESLIAYAMNDLRNKAAALGANFIQHDSPQMGIAGGRDGVTTTTATISGTAYSCSKRKPEGAQTGSGSPTTPSAEPPEGAAGFTFGSTVADAEAKCREKYEWASSSETAFSCSGTPRAIGEEAQVKLKFCDAMLCKIELVVTPSSSKQDDWLDAFVRLEKSLEKKYGAPSHAKKSLPMDCRDDVLVCVRQGTAWLRNTWDFEKGTAIVLRLSNKPGPDAAIRLSYALRDAESGPAL